MKLSTGGAGGESRATSGQRRRRTTFSGDEREIPVRLELAVPLNTTEE